MEVTQFVVSQRDKALLVGDYGSYRTQLSRRLLTVRRKLNYTSTKGRKYTAKPSISVEDIKSNHELATRSLYIFLAKSVQVRSLVTPHR